MESLHTLEKTIADWYKNVPHLPKGGQKWIAENVWWITLIVVILGVFGVFSLFTVIAGLSVLTAGYGAYGGYATVAAGLGGLALAAAWVSLAALAASTVVLAFAVSPLKTHGKKGWDLLFLSEVIYFALGVIGAVISFNFAGIIGPVIGAAIGFYFLFEIRSYFLGAKTEKKEK